MSRCGSSVARWTSDTKDRTGPTLAFDGRSWATFVTGLKADTTS
ncbi:DUF397 domain-containing protein [Micromonospora sp. NBS 11-29]